LARKIVLSSIFCYLFLDVYAQNGCTDPQAVNFDVSATINDGSCIYTTSNYSPSLLQNLPSILLENSGMIFWNDYLWMVNDGGSSPSIYKLDQSGNVLDTISVANATNIDWEALSQSNTQIFIGDFGNNAGNRTNLAIYEINKSELLSGGGQVSAQKHTFKYGDQLNFSLPTNNHSFDCESFYFDNDSLVLLSKAWTNFYTKRYRFPSDWNDTLTIYPQDSIYTDGLITDVSIDTPSKRVFALGYKNNGSNFYTSFVYLLFDYPGSSLFNGNKRRIELGNMLTLSQTEGIAFKDSNSGFLSAEQITSVITIPPKLFSLDFTSFLSGDLGVIDDLAEKEFGPFPNPTVQYVKVPKEWIGKNLFIQNALGQLLEERKIDDTLVLDMSNFPNGTYYLSIEDNLYRLTISH
jgi:hypothetical protein